MNAYGEVPNALLDVREAADHPWMGLTALLNKKPFLVIGKDGNKFILEGEDGKLLKLLQFEWKDATENSRLVAASRQEGSALTKGSVLGGYIVGGVRFHEGEWYVMQENGEDVLPFHSILARIESHRNDPHKLAWDIKSAMARKQGYGEASLRCPECGSQNVFHAEHGDLGAPYECVDCGMLGDENDFLDEPPDYDGDSSGLDWYPDDLDMYTDHRSSRLSGNAQTVVSSTLENGGGTFDPISLDAFAPTTGFFASQDGVSVPEDQFTPDYLAKTINELNLSNGELIGTWVENGQVSIEPAHWFEDEDTALRFAAQNNRSSIWDVANDKAIYIDKQTTSKVSAQFQMNLPPGGVHFRTGMMIERAGLTCVVKYPPIPEYPDGLTLVYPSDDQEQDIDAMDYADEIDYAGGKLTDVVATVDAPDGQEEKVKQIINEYGGLRQ